MYVHRVGIEYEKEFKIILNGEELDEVNEFKYLESVIGKHGGTGDKKKKKGIPRKIGEHIYICTVGNVSSFPRCSPRLTQLNCTAITHRRN